MDIHTIYIKLEKPLADEKYNVNIVNKNNDIIDSEIHKLELKNQSQDNLLATKESLNNHSGSKNNPHNVTKSQVGLSNINNTSDIDKPVSTAQQDAINLALFQSNHYTDLKIADLINGAPETLDTLKELADALSENETFMEALNAAIGEKADQIELNGHINNSVIHITSSNKDSWNFAVEYISDRSNPHKVTKNDIGLSNVENKSATTIKDELIKETQGWFDKVNKLEDNLGDKFSVAKIYTAGNYCIYEDMLYKFISNKESGDWDVSVVMPITIMDALRELNAKMPIILWENPDPTVAFGPQNIILNSSDYNYYEIICSFNPDASATLLTKSIKGRGCVLQRTAVNTAGTATIAYRLIKYISDTELAFDNSLNNSSSGKPNVANTTLVPIRIIGYKS